MATKFSSPPMTTAVTAVAMLLLALSTEHVGESALVKMCLSYKPSGHARTDPILSQTCAADHVHTFYGPTLFHPNTTNKELRESDPEQSTSYWKENQSLYWHPAIYKVGLNTTSGEKTYELAEIAFSGPYYRWDPDGPDPQVEAFPTDFQMIAGMDPTVEGVQLFSECLCPKPCTRSDGLCDSESEFFPSEACGEMGIAMAFPTCWDGVSLGDDNDHMSHMAYTTNGEVDGECPEGFNRRLPQIQLFVRIQDYEGGQYTFSDNTLESDEEVFHADFMNGWVDGALEDLIANCNPIPGTGEDGDYNPPCNCVDRLTRKETLLSLEDDLGGNEAEAAKICPLDTTTYILDEDIVYSEGGLPRGSCTGTLMDKVDPPFVKDCGLEFTPMTFEEGNCDASDDEDEIEDEDEDEEEEEEEEEDEDEDEDSEDEDEDSEDEDSEDEDSEDEDEDSEDEDEDSEDEEDEEEECVDVNKFIWGVKSNGKFMKKKCSWVEKKLEKNDNFCEKKTVKGDWVGEYCPETCGWCDEDEDEEEEEEECVDVEKFVWSKKNNGKFKKQKCSWVEERLEKNEEFCEKKTVKGVLIGEHCPETCGWCDEEEEEEEEEEISDEDEEEDE